MTDLKIKIDFLEEADARPPQKKLSVNIDLENTNSFDIWVFIPQYLDETPDIKHVNIDALELRKRKNEAPYMKVFGDGTFSIFKLEAGKKLKLHDWIFLSDGAIYHGKAFAAKHIEMLPAHDFADIFTAGNMVIPAEMPADAALLKNINAAGKASVKAEQATEYPFDFKKQASKGE